MIAAIVVFGIVNLKSQVLIFINHDCPIAKRYSPEIVRIEKDFKNTSKFTMVYCDPEISEAEVQKHQREFNIPFGYKRDPKLVLARKFGVKNVPCAVVLDGSQKLVYIGRIDDAYGSDFKWRKAISRNLRDALAQAKIGKPVTTAKTTVIGCALSY
jgi:hypothetical protein